MIRTWRRGGALAVAAVALAVLAVPLSGCGTHAHRRMGMRLDRAWLATAAGDGETMPRGLGRLVVAPTTLGEDGKSESAAKAKKTYRVPQKAFDKALADTLRESGAFRSVVAQASGAGGAADLVLRLELDSQTLTFQKRNGNNVPGILLWLFTSPVSHWIHDEDYQLDFSGWAKILDGPSGDLLAEVDLGECSAKASLNLHERLSSVTPYLLTFFIPPTAVGSDEDALLLALLPLALEGAWPDLMASFASVAGEAGVPRGPAVLEVLVPEGAPVDFQFSSPADGEVYEGGPVDVALDLVFPRDSRDLAEVRINDEVVIQYRNKRSRPIEKRIPVDLRGVEPVDGRIVVSVTLDSEIDPVEATILVPDGGSGD